MYTKPFAALILVALAAPHLEAQQLARTIEIHAKRFAFSPAEITLKKGETVDLKLFSDDVPHSLVVKELGINEEATKDHPADATVTPAAVGSFAGKCGRFCGSGHGSMRFTIHVEE
jgi:cytochrome c oxidase subunit II